MHESGIPWDDPSGNRLRDWLRVDKATFYDPRKRNVTETVKAWREYRPRVIPLPHPSPRNLIWLKRNPWFEAEVVPYLRRRVRTLLRDD